MTCTTDGLPATNAKVAPIQDGMATVLGIHLGGITPVPVLSPPSWAPLPPDKYDPTN